jgi:hypothetical protein
VLKCSVRPNGANAIEEKKQFWARITSCKKAERKEILQINLTE